LEVGLEEKIDRSSGIAPKVSQKYSSKSSGRKNTAFRVLTRRSKKGEAWEQDREGTKLTIRGITTFTDEGLGLEKRKTKPKKYFTLHGPRTEKHVKQRRVRDDALRRAANVVDYIFTAKGGRK